MEFRFYREEFATVPILSVDGICPTGPNLSHWPGNRTPAHLKHDLSTGILLRFAALPKREREEYLHGIEIVSNNHFDTDGLLSLWTALNPERALRHANQLLQAAEAGDFTIATTPEATKLDMVVMAFSEPKISPIGLELWNLSRQERYERAYQVLLELVPRIFDQLNDYKDLWREPFARFEESHEYLKNKATVRKFTDIDLTVIETGRELDMRAIQTTAQSDRVLLIQRTPDGNLYHFWYAVSSWFELVTVRKPKRISLVNLAKTLNRHCPGDQGKWLAQELEMPISNLFFGVSKEVDKFLDLPGTLLPNPILSSKVEEIFVSALRAGLSE